MIVMLKCKGFTLIEALICVILLGFLMAAGMQLYFTCDKIMALDVHKKMAAELAKSHMEFMKNVDYDSLETEGQPNVQTIGGLTFTPSHTVAFPTDTTICPDGTGGALCKEVDVTVTWREPDESSNREVLLTTYMAD